MADTIAAQAVWFTAPRTVELRTEHVPPPASHQLRIKALASGISHGTEMLVYRGDVPADLALDLPTLSGSFSFPIKYGYASVGRVIDVGADVKGWRIGESAFVLHPHQSVYVVDAALAQHLDPALDPVHGVFVANLETAINIVHDTPLRFGESAVVFGQGVVGSLVAQLLQLAGAQRVIVVDPLANRRELAAAMGIDAALEPGADLAERVRSMNDGRLADVAIEVSGASAALQHAIDVVMPEGTVVVASWYGTKPVSLMLGGHFHRGRIRLRSSQVGMIDPALSARWDRERRRELIGHLLPRLHLDQLITHRLSLADAPRAYHLIDTSPGETAQVILVYDE